MKTKCDSCDKVYNCKPSKLREENYCSGACRSEAKTVVKPCWNCGTPVKRWLSVSNGEFCCSPACSRLFKQHNMRQLNAELNPTRMTVEVRTKLREKHVGKGEGKAYRKTFGKHTHRVVAAEKAGRELLPGEVVHHIDGNKLNNHPDNLEILPSQSVHASLHAYEYWENKRNGSK